MLVSVLTTSCSADARLALHLPSFCCRSCVSNNHFLRHHHLDIITLSFVVVQDQWYRRAQLALDKGEEELARDALRRKKSFSDNAAMLKKQLDQHTRATGQLSTNIRSVFLIALNCMTC